MLRTCKVHQAALLMNDTHWYSLYHSKYPSSFISATMKGVQVVIRSFCWSLGSFVLSSKCRIASLRAILSQCAVGKIRKRFISYGIWQVSVLNRGGCSQSIPWCAPRGKSLGRYGRSRLAYCFVTRAGSISSFPSAHAPTTTYAAIQPPMDGNGASPAAVPTPLAGAKSGDF